MFGWKTFEISVTGFLYVDVLPIHRTNSVKALEGSADPNRWPGLIFSSSTTGLLKEEALLLHASSPMTVSYTTLGPSLS